MDCTSVALDRDQWRTVRKLTASQGLEFMALL
jgi:hypothetical protein